MWRLPGALPAIEPIIEKIVFEYRVIIVQRLPNFKIDQSQWLTNGYLFPNPVYPQPLDLQHHFGPFEGNLDLQDSNLTGNREDSFSARNGTSRYTLTNRG